MKCRGTFQTDTEAAQRSEQIIRHIDSYHPLQTAYVGRPFPVAVDAKKFAKESLEIDLRKKTTKALSEDVKAKKQEEKQTISDIKTREKKLLDESKEDFVEDPIERYTMLKTKKAQLSWTFAKTMEKLEEMKRIILKTRQEIVDMDAENSEYQKEFLEKYMAARRESGLDEQKDDADQNFIKYLVEDLDIGF
jgi:predicted  nucleic acid-binding Zn-ribbon protein